MESFDVSGINAMLGTLEELTARWECLELQGTVDEDHLTTITEIAECLQAGLKDAKFDRPVPAISTTLMWAKNNRCLYPAAISEMPHLIDAVQHEIGARQFFVLSDRTESYFERANLFGREVSEGFPSACFDIQEAGSCLATDRSTAAVFHLMRVAEWGLRALCADTGLLRIKNKSKGGTVRYTPISYVDWEQMLSQLHPKIDAKINRLRRGKVKQQSQEFYYPLLQDLRAFRDAWRNHVMHTRAIYTVDDALAILNHVKRFMRSLSTRVKEV